jgi:hypothetical protein
VPILVCDRQANQRRPSSSDQLTSPLVLFALIALQLVVAPRPVG